MENRKRKWTVYALFGAAVLASVAAAKPARFGEARFAELVSGARTLSVNITPNGSVPSHASCHFTAAVSGGTAPYHYAWTVNNTPVGSDNSVLFYTNNGSPFHVDVTVTDNNGDQGYDANIMTIGGTCF